MADYELSPAAARDLAEIARYTINTWGKRQAGRYSTALEKHFNAISRGKVRARSFLDHRPEILVTRCEHHYAFFLERGDAPTLILAVFHENMDLIARLKDRLE